MSLRQELVGFFSNLHLSLERLQFIIAVWQSWIWFEPYFNTNLNANFLNQTYGQSPPHHHPSPPPHPSQIINLSNHQFIKSEIIFQKNISRSNPDPVAASILPTKKVFFGPDFSLGFVGAGQRTESWPPTKPLPEPFGAAGRTTGHVSGDLDPPSRIGGIGWVFGSHIIHGKNGYIYLHLDGWLIFFFLGECRYIYTIFPWICLG